MLELAAGLFDTTGFVSRRDCGEWTPALVWLHVGGDLFIWLAYLSIPLILLYFTRRRDLPYPKLFVLFALFILACGFGHFIEALMFKYPLYRLAGVWKVLTAAVSWATVLALIPVIPRVMAAVSASANPQPASPGHGDTSLHRLAAPSTQSRLNDYIVAILAAVLALLLRAAIDEVAQNDHVYVLSLMAVVFVSWQGGFAPAIVTLMISLFGMMYFFVPPRYTLVVEGFGNQLATAMFFFCGVCCAGLGEAQRTARRATKAALAAALEQKDELAAEVALRREAEESVRRSERNLSDFFENANVGLHWVGADGVILRANRAELEMLGYAREEYVGRSVAEFHDSAEAIDDILTRLKRGEKLENYSARLRRKDGTVRDVLISSTVLWEGGRFVHTRCFTRDVTEQKRAEEAVRASEERFRTLTEAIPQIVWNTDARGEVTYVNRRWLDYTGESLETARGRGWVDALHPEDRVEVAASWRETVETAAAGTDDRFAHELRLRNAATGEYRWFLTVAVPLRRPGGAVDQWIGSMADIHDQKVAARQVEEANLFLESTINALTKHIAVLDERGVILKVNDAWRRFAVANGLRAEEFGVGSNYLDVCDVPCPGEDGTRLADTIRAVIRGDRDFLQVVYPCHSPGEQRWFQMRVNRFPGAGPVRVVVSHDNITERVLAEEAVRASEEEFRQLADSMPQIVFAARPDGHVDYFNRRWYEYTGFPDDGSTGDESWAAVHEPGTLPRVLERWGHSLRTGEPYQIEYKLRRADGQFRWHLGRALPVHGPDGRIVRWFGTNTDVHDAKTAAENLRASEERFRTLTEAVPQMVWTADPRGEVTFFNRRWDEYTGAPPEKGRVLGWADLVHPDDAEQLRAEWQLAVASQPDRFTDEFRLRRADGEYRWMLSTAVPLRDPVGAAAEWVGSVTDIDDQKRHAENLERTVRERTAALVEEVEERKRAEAQVREVAAELARSNGELEQFAYVASHDLQEPLRKIQAFGNRLVGKFRDELPELGREYVDRMQTSAGRMRRLIDDLLTYSRVTTHARPFARIDLGKIVREVVSDLSERIEPAGAEVRVGELPALDADPTQMRQLFQNLIANAVKFQKPGVPPVVEVTAEAVTEPMPEPDSEPVAACRVTVRDNGIGFDEKYLDRIFQVFQRLHGRDEYEGTGVGLAICRKIVERHGGAITARSRVGEGAAFVVTLPLRHSNPPAPP